MTSEQEATLVAQTIPPAHGLAGRTVPAGGHPADDPRFVALVEGHYGRLVHVVAAMTGDRHLAEDIVQRTFEKAVRSWPVISGYERLDSWLYKVALNDARRHYSRAVREAQAVHDAAFMGSQASGFTADSFASATTRIDLVRALAELSPRQREVAVLVLLGDRTLTQIAEEIGLAPGTVKATWHTARGRLAQLLRGYASRQPGKGDAHER
ncbi:RNA polymerase sigma factor [Streptomyces sp. NPDC058867]|uniref:RNA polymerase sigma factor n=1 Tax=unclassified Streptomyces TaxID=2593676 RepID=UPI0036CD4ADB